MITIHAGHNPDGMIACGATGIINESTEARAIVAKTILYLAQLGVTAHDCTVDNGTGQQDVLAKIIAKCNACPDAEMNISVHLNCCVADFVGDGKTTGTEVIVYSTSSAQAIEMGTRICEQIAALGFTNRGIKYDSGLRILGNEIPGPCLLLECCFVDDADDVKLYNADSMARAIAQGIAGASITAAVVVPVVPKTLVGAHTHTANQTPAQDFEIVPDGDYVKIVSSIRNMVLDVANGSYESKTPVRVSADDNGTDAQRWKLIPYEYEYGTLYEIESKLKSGMVLDMKDGNVESGAGFWLYPGNDTAAQRFALLPIPDQDGYCIVNQKSLLPIDVDNGGN